MFRAFADVQTADMLDLPRPALAGGKAQVVACPMSEAQAAQQRELIARYERVRSTKVDPREDNALAITTDGRKLALDARLLSAAAADFPGSKVNALVDNVVAVWERSAPVKGTQLIFSDLGVQPTPVGLLGLRRGHRQARRAGHPARADRGHRRGRQRSEEAGPLRPGAGRDGARAARQHA